MVAAAPHAAGILAACSNVSLFAGGCAAVQPYLLQPTDNGLPDAAGACAANTRAGDRSNRPRALITAFEFTRQHFLTRWLVLDTKRFSNMERSDEGSSLNNFKRL